MTIINNHHNHLFQDERLLGCQFELCDIYRSPNIFFAVRSRKKHGTEAQVSYSGLWPCNLAEIHFAAENHRKTIGKPSENAGFMGFIWDVASGYDKNSLLLNMAIHSWSQKVTGDFPSCVGLPEGVLNGMCSMMIPRHGGWMQKIPLGADIVTLWL